MAWGLSSLWGKLAEWFTFIVNFWKGVWDWSVDHFSRFQHIVWIIAATAGAMVMWLCKRAISGIGKLITEMQDMYSGAQSLATQAQGGESWFSGSTVAQVVANVNYIVPLEEMVTVLGVLVSLYAVAITYRFVKSWLPTVN